VRFVRPADLVRLYHDASDASTGTKPKAIAYLDTLLGGPADQINQGDCGEPNHLRFER
jgi:hypothetical protein